MAVRPNGESVYVTNNGNNRSVAQFEVGAGGLLAPLEPALVATGADADGIAVSPDSQSVYVTNFADDSVSQYDVGADGGSRRRPRPRSPRQQPFRRGGEPGRRERLCH